MYYVMSDLHGRYDKYKEMLEKIHFSDEDILYVLGDVVDRGPDGIQILLDMAVRSNVYPILGNHEMMAMEVLKKLNVEIREDNIEEVLTEEIMAAFVDWAMNGGESTCNQFINLTKDEKDMVLDYLNEFTLYETVDVNATTFILVHAGLGNFSKDKSLDDYSAIDLVWTRSDLDAVYYDQPNVKIIVGHTPTPLVNGICEVYFGKEMIDIDCGAPFKDGKLACLCLDTLEVTYI